MKALYRDRADAGRQLAEHLAGYTDQSDVLVLGLSRGGVPVAFEVAKRIHAPLDVLIVRKLGVPGQEELAMGAIAALTRRKMFWFVSMGFGGIGLVFFVIGFLA